jgi:chromate transporter
MQRMDAERGPLVGGEPATATTTVSLRQISQLFLQLGGLSFGGGVTGWAYREIVERRRWLTPQEFLSGLTLSQVLPGINMSNLAIYVGQRLRGLSGATAAILALILIPFFFNIGFYAIYSTVKDYDLAHYAFAGIGAAAIGMILSMCVKSVRASIRTPVQAGVVVLLVVFVGLMRWPMLPMVLVLAPISVYAAWQAQEPSDEE